MTQQDAQTAYQTAKKDIANLLGWFECEMAKGQANINWVQAGTLNHVKENLLETLSFLSGFDIEAIKETLDESRMLEEADAEMENDRN